MTRRSSCSLVAAVLAVALVATGCDHAWAQAPPPPASPTLPASPDSAALAAALERTLPRGGPLRPDRLQHFSLSFALGLGVGIASEQPVAAFAVPGGLGLLKEVDDHRRGRTFDRTDLLVDLLGAGLAALATAALRR